MGTLSEDQIRNRRAEVQGSIAKFQAAIAAMEGELADLDAAERVLARMGGAQRRAAGSANGAKSKDVGEGVAGKPATTTAMIMAVIDDALRTTKKTALEPKEIGDAIDAKGWGPINRDALRTRIWHMAKDGKLVKAKDTSLYSLPLGYEKPAGDDSEGNEPAGLFDPAQGGEARPGGGT